LERTQVFARSWIFLGHETEIPEPGDYVVRYIADDQFIVCRDQDGVIRAHFNACRHRGMQVCRAERGNASHYRCPYHGWTYDNRGKLIGVPGGKVAYGDELRKADWGLLSIPQLATYKGLIFGTLDPDAQPLEDFLGEMKFYLDIIVDRSDSGLEVVGGPQRWIVDANWKLGADNFAGDAYHTLMTHRAALELGMAPPDLQGAIAKYGEHIHTDHGHGLGIVGDPAQLGHPEFLGMPENIVAELQRRLTPEQVDVLRPIAELHGTVFPNLSIGNFMLAKDHVSPPSPHLTLRVWHPIAADKMEIWSYFLVEKDASEEYKKTSYETYTHLFGISGTFEQDDAENWRSITRVLRGELSKRMDLNYQMGRGVLELDQNWPGPGTAYAGEFAEANQRNFYQYWLECLLADPPGDASTNGNHRAATKPSESAAGARVAS
jgi:phenylpropionate dioxygenase-like ring-hydroxylating dioxygenase large terminal subunit